MNKQSKMVIVVLVISCLIVLGAVLSRIVGPTRLSQEEAIEKNSTLEKIEMRFLSSTREELEALSQATEDPVLMALLLENNPRKYGKIATEPDGSQRLYVDGKDVFRAKAIRSFIRATNGTIAVSASTGEGVPFGRAEIEIDQDGATSFSPSLAEIWLIEPKGKNRRYETANVSVEHILPASDASMLVFSGIPVDEAGQSGKRSLYRMDTTTGKWSMLPREHFNEEHHHRDHYVISPIAWKLDSREFYVVEDHGETGGHMKLRTVTLR